MKIIGISHPIPTEYAEKIYNKNKTVFVGKNFLGRASIGDKFIIYESRGAKAYMGIANIKFIGKMELKQILGVYKDKLMLTPGELKKYAEGKEEMTVIEFENFKKFKNPIKVGKYVPQSGKYIYQDEYEVIISKMG